MCQHLVPYLLEWELCQILVIMLTRDKRMGLTMWRWGVESNMALGLIMYCIDKGLPTGFNLDPMQSLHVVWNMSNDSPSNSQLKFQRKKSPWMLIESRLCTHIDRAYKYMYEHSLPSHSSEKSKNKYNFLAWHKHILKHKWQLWRPTLFLLNAIKMVGLAWKIDRLYLNLSEVK